MKNKIEIQKKVLELRKNLEQLEIESKEYADTKTQISTLQWVLKNYKDVDIAQYKNKNGFIEFG